MTVQELQRSRHNLVFPMGAPEKVGMSAARLEHVSRHLQAYVDARKLAGTVSVVARRGTVVHFEAQGGLDLESGRQLPFDALFRIYSMTKPVTSVAAMMLIEEGRMALTDPIGAYMPELKGLKVLDGGKTVPAAREVTVRDLLAHTSGFIYGFDESPLGKLYVEAGLDRNGSRNLPNLAAFIERLSRVPLAFHPGTRWQYGVSTDVLGRLVEVVSGESLPDFFARRIFAPLGMVDTAFHVPAEKRARFTSCYEPAPEGGVRLQDGVEGSRYLSPPAAPMGGAGLVSTAADYLAFTAMLLGEGSANGERLLSRKSIEAMRTNVLPGEVSAFNPALANDKGYQGIGFGLGFSVVLDPTRAGHLGSVGEFAWGGAASTWFWVDPREELVGLLFTQIFPSSTYALGREYRTLVYQAIVD